MGEAWRRTSQAMLLVAALTVLLLCTLSAGFPPDDYADLKEALQDWNQVFKDTFAEGDALYAQGKHDEAVAKYDRCLEISSGNPNALNNKALALLKKGEHEGALQLLDRIIANADAYPAYDRDNILRRAGLNNAAVLIARKEFAEAVEDLEHLSADYPDDKKIEANLAEARAGLATPTTTPKPTPGPSQKMIAHWSFDDGSGTTATDSAGSHDGTIHGGERWVDGVSGKALEFDGKDDYVEIPPMVINDLDEGTIEAWFIVRAQSNGKDQCILQFASAWPNFVRLGMWDNAPDISRASFYINADGESRIRLEGAAVEYNRWHHLAATWDSAVAILYLDGAETARFPDPQPPATHSEARIGYSWGGGVSQSWDGLIDEVRIYDYALSEGEIRQHFNDEAPVASEPPTPTPTSKPTPSPTPTQELTPTQEPTLIPTPTPSSAYTPTPSPTPVPGWPPSQSTILGLGAVLLVALLLAVFRLGKAGRGEALVVAPVQEALLETPSPAPTKMPVAIAPEEPEAAPTGVVVKRGYDVEGEYLRFFVKVENHTDIAINDVKVWLDYPDDKVDLEKPKNATQRIGNLYPGDKKSVKYYLKPRACIETSIEGKVFYKDVHGEKVELDVKKKEVVNVCPLLKQVSITWEEFQSLWYSSGLADTKETKSYSVGLRTSMDVVKTSLSNMTLVGEEGTESFWHAAFAAKQKNSDKHVLADIQIAGSISESSVTIEVKTEDPNARAGFIINVVESITLQIRKMEVL